MKLSFKVSGQQETFEMEVEPTMTIADVKTLAAAKTDIAVDRQKVIWKGRILKDTDTLAFYNVEDGSCMHIVKGPDTTSTAAPAAPTPAAPAPAPEPSMGANPMAGLSGLLGQMGQGQGGGNPFGNLMSDPNIQNMMGNMGAGGAGGMPDMGQLQSMMSNPGVQQAMQQVLSNPEMMRSMMNNPMMQQMTNNNPQLQQMMSNPDLMAQMGNMFGAGGLGGMPGFQGAGAAAAGAASNLPLNERYAAQLSQLENMGFVDREINLRALDWAKGDVNVALNFLIGGQ